MELEKYLEKMGFQTNPFDLTFGSPGALMSGFVQVQRADLKRLEQALRSGKVVTLTSELGVGKTTVCKFISLKLEGDEKQKVVSIFVPRAAYKNAEQLLRAIIRQLELDATGSYPDLFETLRRWPVENPDVRLAIVIDDVPESGDVHEIGEFLRTLADIKNISILLNGVPKQMENFLNATPALRDRVQVSVELEQMDDRQMKQLLQLRMKLGMQKGSERRIRPLLTKDAFQALYKVSKGIPRASLKAASKALYLAAERNRRIDVRIVREANRVSLWQRFLGWVKR